MLRGLFISNQYRYEKPIERKTWNTRRIIQTPVRETGLALLLPNR